MALLSSVWEPGRLLTMSAECRHGLKYWLLHHVSIRGEITWFAHLEDLIEPVAIVKGLVREHQGLNVGNSICQVCAGARHTCRKSSLRFVFSSTVLEWPHWISVQLPPLPEPHQFRTRTLTAAATQHWTFQRQKPNIYFWSKHQPTSMAFTSSEHSAGFFPIIKLFFFNILKCKNFGHFFLNLNIEK